MSTKIRKTHLVNFNTGEEIQTNSISEFCRRANLNKNDKYHMTPVLDGERLTHKGWVLPSLLNNRTIICDLNGKEYSIRELLRIKKQFSLTVTSLNKLLSGEISIYKGLHLKYGDAKFVVPKKYEYTFSNGESTIKVKNVSAAGRMFHRERSNFSHCIRGKIDSAFGYKLVGVNELETSGILN